MKHYFKNAIKITGEYIGFGLTTHDLRIYETYYKNHA